ncbi:hypothetical protein B0H13DRAFT_1882211 [Mycena leptocephala]|nr:hypothetical protein B0H13DRAFT_1882211 [Mycena leptocephala]
MASTTAITTSASDSASVKAEPSSPATTTPPTTNDTKTSDAALAPNANANGGQAPAPKRRAARRANTAERRATHNAVERMRRETLNGRFLTLASLLPPLRRSADRARLRSLVRVWARRFWARCARSLVSECAGFCALCKESGAHESEYAPAQIALGAYLANPGIPHLHEEIDMDPRAGALAPVLSVGVPVPVLVADARLSMHEEIRVDPRAGTLALRRHRNSTRLAPAPRPCRADAARALEGGGGAEEGCDAGYGLDCVRGGEEGGLTCTCAGIARHHRPSLPSFPPRAMRGGLYDATGVSTGMGARGGTCAGWLDSSRGFAGSTLEVNEWRARARVPQLELPVRSEGHATVLRAELEDFDLTLEEGLELEEGDEDGAEEDNDNDNEGVESPVSPRGQQQQQHGQQARARSASTISTPGSSHGHAGFFGPAPIPSHRQSQTPQQQQQQAHSRRFAFDAPSPPSPSSASSASGGWDGPATPPASAGAGPMMLPLPAMGLPTTMGGMKGYDGKGFYDAPGAAGAAYDLGLGFDGEESLLLGSSGLGVSAGGMIGGWAGASPSHPAFHQQQQQVQQQAIRLREVYEQQQAMLASGMGMGMGVPMGMGMGMGMNGGMGMQMGMQMPIAGMGMGMGVPFGVAGVAQGQYLHQPARFALLASSTAPDSASIPPSTPLLSTSTWRSLRAHRVDLTVTVPSRPPADRPTLLTYSVHFPPTVPTRIDLPIY